MTAVKSCWSILVLEDNANLRELLRGNFGMLLGNAVHVDFAASICQAIAKVKGQMLRGNPYDLFWVDLYLDYFSYDDDHGEIIAAKSFSQIIDTAAFLEQHAVTELRWPALIGLLQAPITPPHKESEHYSDREKLAVLQRFLPYCLPAAQASFSALLDLMALYLTAAHDGATSASEENIYVHNALAFIFHKLQQWVGSSAQKEFEMNDKGMEEWQEAARGELVPSRNAKSDQSWTLFHAWAEQFYSHVALGARGYEAYSQANPLLAELKRLAPEGYPLFLVNTAYPGRRAELLEAAAIWPAENVIVGQHDFKGSQRDRLMVEYLARLFRQCRRPYFFLRSRRRGANTFAISSDISAVAARMHNIHAAAELLIDERDAGFAFSHQAFFPELTSAFEKASNVEAEFLAELRRQTLQDMQDCLQERQPRMMQNLWLTVPPGFFKNAVSHESFTLELQAPEGTRQRVTLTFDEGRWILFELACRRWFPKCFFMHSSWTVRHKHDGQQVYFHSTPELLAAALVHATYDHPELFPPAHDAERLARTLQPAPAFYRAQTPYADAFDWPAFWQETFGQLDARHQWPARLVPVLQARRMLILAIRVLKELHIRRLANHLLRAAPLTALDWPGVMTGAEFLPAEKTLTEHLYRLEKGEAAYMQAQDLLPKLRNLLSVVLCFYSFPTVELGQFYRYWESKQIPTSGTRPTEKFSSVNGKLENLRFMHSVPLPAQAEGKSRFLFVPAFLGGDQSQIMCAAPALETPLHDDVTAGSFLDFLALVPSLML
ncbi:MAG: hypothetical protein DKINENOH_00495 [bacterium]|nr:hypothetical protein [bacterium]